MTLRCLSVSRIASPDGEAAGQAFFLQAVTAGLAGEPKAIPCKFLYDERGSALFERICELPEYYPTRTEIALLRSHRRAIAGLIGPGCRLVEFGAGSSQKARLLLSALERPRAYIPVDISREHLLHSAAAISRDHAGLTVVALHADYTADFDLPEPAHDPGGRHVGFFPGSTIGNFTPDEAGRFLSRARRLLRGGPMVVGVDLKKSVAVLDAAYNDAAGVTAAFNLNLLIRINRELGADFRLDRFRHHAFYNARFGRVEMHLVSKNAQTVRMNGRTIAFREGETIHTENSYKYTVEEFSRLAEMTGFATARVWTDSDRKFGIFFLEAAEGFRSQPT